MMIKRYLAESSAWSKATGFSLVTSKELSLTKSHPLDSSARLVATKDFSFQQLLFFLPIFLSILHKNILFF